MKNLLVSAVRFEAEAALSVLRQKDDEWDYFEVGIGPLNAAKSEAALAAVAVGKRVVFIGSCGSFYPFQRPHLVSIDTVFWMPPCVRTGLAQMPDGIHPPVALAPSGFPLLPKKKLLTTPSISLRDDILPNLDLPARDDLVENMELYACIGGMLANAAKFDVIMGVTNQVGPLGREQWRANFKHVTQMTADFIANSKL